MGQSLQQVYYYFSLEEHFCEYFALCPLPSAGSWSKLIVDVGMSPCTRCRRAEATNTVQPRPMGIQSSQCMSHLDGMLING